MKRIALFLPDLRGGGAERVMIDLAGEISRRGHEVDFVLGSRRGSYANSLQPEVNAFDLEADRVLAAIPGLIGYLRSRTPMVLMSTLTHANVAVVIARELSATSTRLVLRETNPRRSKARETRTIREKALPFLMRMLYSRADVWIANSKRTAEDLVEVSGNTSASVVTIPNPVDVERIRLLARSPLPEYWPSDDRPVVLGVGRLHPAKDFETLVDAFEILRDRQHARLVILGEGQHRDVLEKRVVTSGLDSDVIMPGFVDNPYAPMSRSAVLALTSRYEGFGNVLVEAMALGTPVVATRCPGGPSEILQEGRLGPLVPVGDADALAKALQEVIEAPPDPPSLQERAEDFRLASVTDEYLKAMGVRPHA